MANRFPLLLKHIQSKMYVGSHWTAQEVEGQKASIIRHHEKFCAAAAKLDAALLAGTITNADFNAIKEDFNYAMRDVRFDCEGVNSVCVYINMIPGLLKRARAAEAPWSNVAEEILPLAVAMEKIQGKAGGKQVAPTMITKRQPKAETVEPTGYVRPSFSTAAQKKVVLVLEEITQVAYDAMVERETKRRFDKLVRIVKVVNASSMTLDDWAKEKIKAEHNAFDEAVKARSMTYAAARDLRDDKIDRIEQDFLFAQHLVVAGSKPVKQRPDVDVIIDKQARRYVDELRTFFVNRNLRKLAPIVDAMKGGFDLRAAQTHLSINGFASELVATASSKAAFRTRMQAVLSYSSKGKPFNRFPVTFHNVVLPTGEKMGQPSEKRMNEVFAKA